MSAPVPHMVEGLLSCWLYMGASWPSACWQLSREILLQTPPRGDQVQNHKKNIGQSSNILHNTMSSANFINIPSPTPSSFTVNMDIAKLLPTCPQVETPVVHKQNSLSIPLEVVAASYKLSELLLSPRSRSICTVLEGHSSPGQEELLHITQGLAGVVQKNEEVSCSNNKQLEVLWQ